MIDFPQAINAKEHPGAFSLLCRDIDRLCRYFRKCGVEADAEGFAGAMWERYVRGELREKFVERTVRGGP